jgi:hypothetical protein
VDQQLEMLAMVSFREKEWVCDEKAVKWPWLLISGMILKACCKGIGNNTQLAN